MHNKHIKNAKTPFLSSNLVLWVEDKNFRIKSKTLRKLMALHAAPAAGKQKIRQKCFCAIEKRIDCCA